MPEEMASSSMPKPILRQAAIIASEQAQGRGGGGNEGQKRHNSYSNNAHDTGEDSFTELMPISIYMMDTATSKLRRLALPAQTPSQLIINVPV